MDRNRTKKISFMNPTGEAPWRAPLKVRPKIQEAFRKWKEDPESVYKNDRHCSKHLGVSRKTTQGEAPEFVIPGMAGMTRNSSKDLAKKIQTKRASVPRTTNADPDSAAALELTYIKGKW